ncbi:hypothetical protein DFH07DRAFT_948776 [Mycena maculata]|uniref:Uncharacterized protein n=1 Tax=Mycena maculata TaxID=230809 RepID=A0AAD7P1F7_9AGAR|nr:hypothetical protein DFH07DRAFT_948776 [Mycena maculata]
MMGQAGPGGGYMPIYAPPLATSYPAAQTPFIPPGVMIETPPPAQSQPLNTKNRPKHSRRAAATPLPLKSALKKPAATGAAIVPAAPVPYAEPVQPRRRTNSKADKYATIAPPNEPFNKRAEESYHMFVTFKGDSELLLENTLDQARKDIEREIFNLWPHGVDAQIRGSTWSIRFRNAPWNMNGPDVQIAWRLIVQLFTLFSQRGFSFITTTKCTTMQPRLIFQITPADTSSTFFLAYFSRGGRRVSLITPPHHIAVAFGPQLRALLPNQIEVTEDKGMVLVETRREMGASGVKPSHFLMQILKVMCELGFYLNATVPMARGGPLGMGARRELYVFKGVVPTGQ